MHPINDVMNNPMRNARVKPGEAVGVVDEHHVLHRQWGKVVDCQDNTVIVEFEIRPTYNQVWKNIEHLKWLFEDTKATATTKIVFHRWQLTTDSGY